MPVFDDLGLSALVLKNDVWWGLKLNRQGFAVGQKIGLFLVLMFKIIGISFISFG